MYRVYLQLREVGSDRARTVAKDVGKPVGDGRITWTACSQDMPVHPDQLMKGRSKQNL